MKNKISYQSKSKEELISELVVLQQKYNSLKKSFDTNIRESTELNFALSKLNQYSVELSNLSPFVNLEMVISKMVKEITGAKAVVFSDYDTENKTLNPQHIEMEPGLLKKVIGLLGQQIKKIHAPVSEEMYQEITSEIIGTRKTLYESTFGAVSSSVGAVIQKLLNVDRFIGIAYLIEGKLYGTSLLAMSRDKPDPPKQILENILFLAAVSLRRRKTEQAFLDSEERFRTLFEGAPDAIFIADPESKKVLDANRAASALLLKKHEEIVGMYHYELHPPSPDGYLSLKFDNQVKETLVLGFTHPIESNVVRSDGKLIPVEIIAQMILLKGQQVLMGTFRNITERKQSESAMQQILAELQTLIENLQQGIMLENEDRRIIFSNSKFCELFGIRSPEDIQGIHCTELIQQAQSFADPAGFVNSIEKRLSEQIPVLSEELPLADGRTFERDFIPVAIGENKYRNYWIYRDVTKRKQAEKELRESQTQISAILKAIPDMMFLQNNEGVYIDYYAPQETQLYVPPEVFIGRNMSEVLPPQVVEEFKSVFESAIRTRLVKNFEYSLLLPKGEAYFESRTIAYDDDKVLSLIREITERKLSELKIQQQYQELKKLNDDKDRFMSILAHDLKNPFNAILGFLDLLSDNIHKYDITKIEKQIKIIRNSSKHFYQLLESLLIWARSQSGNMPYNPEKIKFNDIYKKIIAILKLNAEEKKISVDITAPEEIFVFADMEMLKTILRNLISNAIKFTNTGGRIEISVENNSDIVTIVVSDNGIGITQDILDTIFDISTYHTTTGTAGEYGSGLGLFLCKELVEKHNGKIWVESEPGIGSTFKFTLPRFIEN